MCGRAPFRAILFGMKCFRAVLSEDPGPHAVFFSCVRRAGRGGGIQGVSVVVVVVVGSQKYWKNKEILVFDGVGHGF